MEKVAAFLVVFAIFMKLEEFQKNFPIGTEVPETFVRLLEFQNIRDLYFGNFSLIDFSRDEVLLLLFGENNRDAASQFIVFGHSPAGASYGYWLYDKHTIDTAPIAVIGFGGDGNTVIANSLQEFLQIISIGEDPLCYVITEWGWTDRNEIEVNENLEDYRKWLFRELTLTVPTIEEADAIVTSAKNAHPDFDQWIQALV
ncbi:MAG: SMI1/KNR4 family protein [Tildeniella nuda ZEHNDER 1965/U140]|nr:SMI1/KNR4 family protein [Tildeniella nuda ZEHNDER 1965/U140]